MSDIGGQLQQKSGKIFPIVCKLFSLNAADPEKNWSVVTAPGAAWEVAMELEAENPLDSRKTV